MVGIHIHTNAAKVSAYHADHLAADSSRQEYYSEDDHLVGQWFGKGSTMLGLNGDVSKTHFDRLCRNLHPKTKKQLTVRRNDDARVAYDFCISAPKSVSVLALVMEDSRIVKAHDIAVQETLTELENLSMTRVRGNGASHDRASKNVTAALFRHHTSRATDPHRAADPQLHTHAIVFNNTYDTEEKRWKAIQTLEMHRQSGLATAIYRNRLSKELHKIGYMTAATTKGFDVVGFPKAVADVFSKRRMQIDAIEKALGKSGNAALRARIAHTHRVNKDSTKTPEELRQSWHAQLTMEQLLQLDALVTAAVAPVAPGRQYTADEALELAARHLFERRSVVKRSELYRQALTISCGQHDLAAFQNALGNAGQRFRFHENEVTTQAAVDAEREMIKFVDDNATSCVPLNADFVCTEKLSLEQRQAVTTLLSSHAKVMELDGPAGTGKTTTLTELARGLRAKGHDLLVCAPTAAATDVLRKGGFAHAITLQRLLTDTDRQKDLNGSVIVLDEAGCVSVGQFNKLFAIAQSRGCRILLSGDSRQHKSIESVDALRILETHSKLERAGLSMIFRQTHEGYKDAVDAMKSGNHRKGFAKLAALGWVKEVDDADRYQEIASDYLSVLAAKKSCLIVCATWRESELVTEKIRALMREKHLLSAKEERVQVLDPLHFTEAQRQQCNSYEAGQVIVFQRKSVLCARGECLEVLGVENDFVKVRKQKGGVLLLDPRKDAKRIAAFTRREMPVASGDRLLIRANGTAKTGQSLVNGELVTVKAISKNGEIALADGRIIPAAFRHLRGGHAISCQSSQGKTVDVVLCAIDAKSAKSATTKETFYVAASRAKERCTIYTDSKKRLSEALKRSAERQAAIEFVRQQTYEKKQPHPSPGTAARKSLPEARLAPPSQTKRQHHLCEELRRRANTAVRLKRVHSHARNQDAALQNEQRVRGLPGGGGGLPLPPTDLAGNRGFLPSLGR